MRDFKSIQSIKSRNGDYIGSSVVVRKSYTLLSESVVCYLRLGRTNIPENYTQKRIFTAKDEESIYVYELYFSENRLKVKIDRTKSNGRVDIRKKSINLSDLV